MRTFNKETLPAIPKLLQIGGDRCIKIGGLGLLLAQRRGKPLHFLLERLAVVLLRLGANVATRRETWLCLRISSSIALLQKPRISQYLGPPRSSVAEGAGLEPGAPRARQAW